MVRFDVLLLITMACIAYGAITESPSKLSACIGTSLTLNWDYDNKTSLYAAVWYKDDIQIGTLLGISATAEIIPTFSDKVTYVDKGTIELIDISLTDAGNYKFAVSYTISAGLRGSTSEVTVTVKAPPIVPSSSISETGKMNCSTPYLGSPPAQVYTEAGNGCCVSGESVTCLKETTDRNTTYCSKDDPECPEGEFGDPCQQCGNCKSNDICDKATGRCPYGCQPGYIRPLCKQQCPDGEFGDPCQRCGNCRNNDKCDKATGTCPNECQSGYIGALCNQLQTTKAPPGGGVGSGSKKVQTTVTTTKAHGGGGGSGSKKDRTSGGSPNQITPFVGILLAALFVTFF